VKPKDANGRYLTMLLGQFCPAQRHAPGGVFWMGQEDEAERAGRDAVGVPVVAGDDPYVSQRDLSSSC